MDKMRPEDRLVLRGGRGSPPDISQLEWNYGVSGTWIGRLPRTNSIAIPATTMQTNSPASTK
jgi:hypothetical protein